MFTNKKDADAHDKMLELAESFSELFESHIDGLNDVQLESLGLLLAKNKDAVLAACKGNTTSLGEIEADAAASNVAPIKSTK